jgi:hypothetical protein
MEMDYFVNYQHYLMFWSIINQFCHVCLGPLLCLPISSDFDQTWYGGSESQMKGRVRVWYKFDINFRFYAAILDFSLLQQNCCHLYVESGDYYNSYVES